jgi:hypothetical protein
MSRLSPPIRVRIPQRLLTAEEVATTVRAVRLARAGGSTVQLSDVGAATIASWWVSPDSQFQRLASEEPVGRDALLADVDRCIEQCHASRPAAVSEEDDVDLAQLLLLREWVESKP